jgi:hypothetical protein
MRCPNSEKPNALTVMQWKGKVGLLLVLLKAVVLRVGCTAPWGALEVGSSEHIVHLFTVEMTLDQTLGNWYHFIKPIHHMKNLPTVK